MAKYVYCRCYLKGENHGTNADSINAIILNIAIFYFLLIRPQQRRAKEHKEMVAAVQRGDKIVSSGGIRGKVMKVIGDTDVEVEISSGVNVVIIKSTIAEVERDSSAK